MARFHINPATGEASVCKATIKCPFGDMQHDHYDSAESARTAYEQKAEAEFSGVSSLKRAAAPTASSRLFGSNDSRELVGSVVGKDYSTVISNAKKRSSMATEYFARAEASSPSVDLTRHTEAASAETRVGATAALAARRAAGANKATLTSVGTASASSARDARAALGARNTRGNSFLSGVRSMAAAA